MGPTIIFDTMRKNAGASKDQQYRIPAVVVATNGNIVAIADNRYTHGGDIGQKQGSGAIDIVYKISKDGGKNWSEEKMILPKSKVPADLKIADNKGDALVFKALDGTLVVLAVSGGGYASADSDLTPSRMLRSESRDNGENWTTWQEVGQPLFDVIEQKHGRKQGFATSGRGLTLKDGTFAAGLSVYDSRGVNAVYAYSTDKGMTWNYGGNINHNDNTVFINEPKPIAELEDGKILMSVRNARKGGGANNQDNPRLYAIFGKKGESMPNQLSKWDFRCGNVDAEGVVWTRKSDGHGITRILHLQAGPNYRYGLGLWLSEDEGINWSQALRISEDRACYSSIDVAGDGTVITLAEEGSNNGLHYDIVFRRYNMYTITKGQYSYKTEWYKGEINKN